MRPLSNPEDSDYAKITTRLSLPWHSAHSCSGRDRPVPPHISSSARPTAGTTTSVTCDRRSAGIVASRTASTPPGVVPSTPSSTRWYRASRVSCSSRATPWKANGMRMWTAGHIRFYGGSAGKRRAVRAAASDYPQWHAPFARRGMRVHAALGDHEIGDNWWNDPDERALVPTFRGLGRSTSRCGKALALRLCEPSAGRDAARHDRIRLSQRTGPLRHRRHVPSATQRRRPHRDCRHTAALAAASAQSRAPRPHRDIRDRARARARPARLPRGRLVGADSHGRVTERVLADARGERRRPLPEWRDARNQHRRPRRRRTGGARLDARVRPLQLPDGRCVSGATRSHCAGGSDGEKQEFSTVAGRRQAPLGVDSSRTIQVRGDDDHHHGRSVQDRTGRFRR